METTPRYVQDLKEMAKSVHKHLCQAIDHNQKFLNTTSVNWHTLSIFHCKLATLEYVNFVLTQETSSFHICLEKGLFVATRAFLTNTPTPLSPVNSEHIAKVVDTVRCIVALLYYTAPWARETWTEHLVFLDKFWFVYTKHIVCRETHFRGRSKAVPSETFADRPSAAASDTDQTAFSKFLETDSCGAVKSILEQTTISLATQRIDHAISNMVLKIYKDVFLHKNSSSTIREFQPIRDSWYFVFPRSQEHRMGK